MKMYIFMNRCVNRLFRAQPSTPQNLRLEAFVAVGARAKWSRLWLIFLCVMSGCAQQPQTLTPLKSLASEQHWNLKGKLGFRLPDESGSAYFNWQQSNDAFDIRLNGPLGQGAARLHGDRHGVTLEHNNQNIRAKDPETLMQQQLGWGLPVSQLLYWVRALPAPNAPIVKIERNSQQQMVELNQQGWKLHYREYNLRDGRWLPTKLTLQQGQIKLTLIMKDWQFD